MEYLETKNNRCEKFIKLIEVLLAAAGICSLVVFIPQVREMIIGFGEKLAGRGLTHEVWNGRFIRWECEFLLVLLLLFVFLKILTAYLRLPMPFFDFIEQKISKISMDDWIHYISFAIFIVGVCVIHFGIIEGGDDTAYFNHALNGTTYFDFLKSRYNNWSTRLLIESVLINVYYFNFGLWRFLDVIAFTVIAECIVILTMPEKKYSLIIYAIILLFTPYDSLHTAGWGATTVNYLWPLAAALPSFVVAKNIFNQKESSKHLLAVSVFGLIFAVNQEQVAALIFGLYFSFLIFHLVQNRKFQNQDFYFIFAIILSFASIIFILTSPGNKIRYIEEMKNWFPEYNTLSFFDKIQLGILTICTYYFSFQENFVLIPLCIVLSLIFYKKNKNSFIFQIALNLFLLILLIIKNVFKTDFLLFNNLLPQFSKYSKISVSIECAVYVLLGIFLLYQVFSAMKDKKQGLLNVFFMCAGFCSAFIIAFSPTVYASGSRCYLFFTSIIFILTFRIYYEWKKEKL